MSASAQAAARRVEPQAEHGPGTRGWASKVCATTTSAADALRVLAQQQGGLPGAAP